MIGYLEEEFKEEFGNDKLVELDIGLDNLIDNDFEDLEYNGLIFTCTKEKVNPLQYNICVNVSFDQNIVQLMFESGINNGTQLNEYSINSESCLSNVYRFHEVVTDVEVDFETMDRMGVKYCKVKTEIMLQNNKSAILNLHSNQIYDNYVTGGGTNKTNEYYNSEIQKLNSKGLYWKYVSKTEAIKADFS